MTKTLFYNKKIKKVPTIRVSFVNNELVDAMIYIRTKHLMKSSSALVSVGRWNWREYSYLKYYNRNKINDHKLILVHMLTKKSN